MCKMKDVSAGIKDMDFKTYRGKMAVRQKGTCVDPTGIAPDVRIPLPYPKRLTDNIDEWVLWVAKDLKR